MALLAGRLGVVVAGGPAVGLVGFLWGPGVAEAGRLGLVAAAGLAFVAVGFAAGVDAAGFMGCQKAKSRIERKTKENTTTTTKRAHGKTEISSCRNVRKRQLK